MIQRIQTIFFLLAGACFGGEFATSFAAATTTQVPLFADGVYNVFDHIGLQLLAGLGLVMCLLVIFLYKNRQTQIKIGYLCTTLAILLPVAAVLIYMNQTQSAADFQVEDQLGIYLPIGMIIFSLLGVKYVKRDDKLVESMDRLR